MGCGYGKTETLPNVVLTMTKKKRFQWDESDCLSWVFGGSFQAAYQLENMVGAFAEIINNIGISKFNILSVAKATSSLCLMWWYKMLTRWQ